MTVTPVLNQAVIVTSAGRSGGTPRERAEIHAPAQQAPHAEPSGVRGPYCRSAGGVHFGHWDSPTSMPCSYTATSRNGFAARLLS